MSYSGKTPSTHILRAVFSRRRPDGRVRSVYQCLCLYKPYHLCSIFRARGLLSGCSWFKTVQLLFASLQEYVDICDGWIFALTNDKSRRRDSPALAGGKRQNVFKTWPNPGAPPKTDGLYNVLPFVRLCPLPNPEHPLSQNLRRANEAKADHQGRLSPAGFGCFRASRNVSFPP